MSHTWWRVEVVEALGERRIFFFSPALISFRAAESSTSWRCGGVGLRGRAEGEQQHWKDEACEAAGAAPDRATLWGVRGVNGGDDTHSHSITLLFSHFLFFLCFSPSFLWRWTCGCNGFRGQPAFIFFGSVFFFFYNPSQWLNYCPCSGDDGDKQRARGRRAWNRSRVVLFESFILFFSRRAP